MEPLCSKCQNKFIPQFKFNKTIQYYKMCESCRPIKTNINVDCINYDKFNKLITDLHESIASNKQVLKVVEGERSSLTYLIQTMNSYLIKLNIKSDNVIDTEIQNEIIKLKYRMDDLESLLNTRFGIIENGINELMKTIIHKL